MRNILASSAIIALIIALPCVSAESYSISGTATYSNSLPVEIGKIQVECEEFEYDCHTFRGHGGYNRQEGGVHHNPGAR